MPVTPTKRSSEASDGDNSAKRACVNASTFKEHVLGYHPVPTFLPIMYDTWNAGWHLPLQIMHTDNLEQLVTNRGGPPAVKKSPNPDLKATLIYDLDTLQKRFGNDEAITFPQWLDAIVNCMSFKSTRDKLGLDGPYAMQIATLHDFFSCLHNAEQTFQVW
ncbi:hypothetical protein FISHEDRAFT_44325, partial [Fistulina hepatica ATCC 64428]